MDCDATQAIDFGDYGDETDDETTANEKHLVANLKMLQYKEYPEKIFPIYEGVNVIGRDENCQVFLPAKSLSKQHTCIEVVGGMHLVYDMKSRNKTRRDKLFLRPDVRYELKNNDKLMLADVDCVYMKLDAPKADAEGSETDSLPENDPVSAVVIGNNNNKVAAATLVANDDGEDTDSGSDTSCDLLQPTAQGEFVHSGDQRKSGAFVEDSFVESNVGVDKKNQADACDDSLRLCETVMDTPAPRAPITTVTPSAMATQYLAESECEDTDEDESIVTANRIIPSGRPITAQPIGDEAATQAYACEDGSGKCSVDETTIQHSNSPVQKLGSAAPSSNNSPSTVPATVAYKLFADDEASDDTDDEQHVKLSTTKPSRDSLLHRLSTANESLAREEGAGARVKSVRNSDGVTVRFSPQSCSTQVLSPAHDSSFPRLTLDASESEERGGERGQGRGEGEVGEFAKPIGVPAAKSNSAKMSHNATKKSSDSASPDKPNAASRACQSQYFVVDSDDTATQAYVDESEADITSLPFRNVPIGKQLVNTDNIPTQAYADDMPTQAYPDDMPIQAYVDETVMEDSGVMMKDTPRSNTDDVATQAYVDLEGSVGFWRNDTIGKSERRENTDDVATQVFPDCSAAGASGDRGVNTDDIETQVIAEFSDSERDALRFSDVKDEKKKQLYNTDDIATQVFDTGTEERIVPSTFNSPGKIVPKKGKLSNTDEMETQAYCELEDNDDSETKNESKIFARFAGEENRNNSATQVLSDSPIPVTTHGKLSSVATQPFSYDANKKRTDSALDEPLSMPTDDDAMDTSVSNISHKVNQILDQLGFSDSEPMDNRESPARKSPAGKTTPSKKPNGIPNAYVASASAAGDGKNQDVVDKLGDGVGPSGTPLFKSEKTIKKKAVAADRKVQFEDVQLTNREVLEQAAAPSLRVVCFEQEQGVVKRTRGRGKAKAEEVKADSEGRQVGNFAANVGVESATEPADAAGVKSKGKAGPKSMVKKPLSRTSLAKAASEQKETDESVVLKAANLLVKEDVVLNAEKEHLVSNDGLEKENDASRRKEDLPETKLQIGAADTDSALAEACQTDDSAGSVTTETSQSTGRRVSMRANKGSRAVDSDFVDGSPIPARRATVTSSIVDETPSRRASRVSAAAGSAATPRARKGLKVVDKEATDLVRNRVGVDERGEQGRVVDEGQGSIGDEDLVVNDHGKLHTTADNDDDTPSLLSHDTLDNETIDSSQRSEDEALDTSSVLLNLPVLGRGRQSATPLSNQNQSSIVSGETCTQLQDEDSEELPFPVVNPVGKRQSSVSKKKEENRKSAATVDGEKGKNTGKRRSSAAAKLKQAIDDEKRSKSDVTPVKAATKDIHHPISVIDQANEEDSAGEGTSNQISTTEDDASAPRVKSLATKAKGPAKGKLTRKSLQQAMEAVVKEGEDNTALLKKGVVVSDDKNSGAGQQGRDSTNEPSTSATLIEESVKIVEPQPAAKVSIRKKTKKPADEPPQQPAIKAKSLAAPPAKSNTADDQSDDGGAGNASNKLTENALSKATGRKRKNQISASVTEKEEEEEEAKARRKPGQSGPGVKQNATSGKEVLNESQSSVESAASGSRSKSRKSSMAMPPPSEPSSGRGSGNRGSASSGSGSGVEFASERKKGKKGAAVEKTVVEALTQTPRAARRSQPGAESAASPTRTSGRGSINDPPTPSTSAAESNPTGGCGGGQMAPRVMFTGVVEEEGQMIVKSLGGEMVDSIFDCTHLVTDQVRRTVKFLCGLARGLPIVSSDWLAGSKKAGKFIDEKPYLIRDKVNEKKFGFSLVRSIDTAREHRLMLGYRLHVTKSVRPDPDQMRDIIQCAGGEYVGALPKRTEDRLVVVTCAEDRAQCAGAERAGVPLVSAEFILTGLLRQELDLETYRLPAAEGEKESKATKRKTLEAVPVTGKSRKK